MRLLIITLLIITGCAAGKAQNPGKAEVTEYPMTESGLLWQITSNNSEDTSYLFGTMHMIQEEYYIFPDWLDEKVTSSDVLVMELAGLPNPFEAMKYIMLPEGSVWDYFNDEQEDSLAVWAKEVAGMEEEMFKSTFSKMKPFALVQLSALQLMGEDTKSYEEEFQKLAESKDIELSGLETVGDQMKIFDDMTMEEQAEMVMQSVRESEDDSAELLKEMQSTYFRQQIDSLYMIIHSEGGMIAEKEKTFLSDRNHNWIPQIKELVDKKKAFIAVGAGHLGGPEGVIRLLQKEGYTLTPIEL
jgi:uncharacterized protein YbaP (TraB family)